MSVSQELQEITLRVQACEATQSIGIKQRQRITWCRPSCRSHTWRPGGNCRRGSSRAFCWCACCRLSCRERCGCHGWSSWVSCGRCGWTSAWIVICLGRLCSGFRAWFCAWFCGRLCCWRECCKECDFADQVPFSDEQRSIVFGTIQVFRVTLSHRSAKLLILAILWALLERGGQCYQENQYSCAHQAQ
jgi:hypothetical protein